MPVNQRIREDIDRSIVNRMSIEDFHDALLRIIPDIFSLGRTNTVDIMHTSAYLSYRISRELMRSSNEAQQYQYGLTVTPVLEQIYNEQSTINTFSGIVARDHAMQTFANFYTFHARLLFFNGPNTDSALSALQHIIGNTLGPWMAHIRVEGNTPSDPNIRVIQLREGSGTPPIIIGDSQLLHVNPNRIRTATWNMQGSSASTEDKWRNGVLRLARRNDIVCLQEFGSVPSSVVPVGSHYTEDQFGVQYLVEQYSWNAGSTSRPENYRIYFFQVNRLRVNLAFVLPDDGAILVRNFIVVSDGLDDRTRPAVGLRIAGSRSELSTDTTFFTFHAISGGGPNDPRMLREISRHTPTPFVVLGDFNRDPSRPPDPSHPNNGDWVAPPGIGVITEAQGDTHGSGPSAAMLDYAVTNSTVAEFITAEPVIPNLPSDHRAAPFYLDFSSLS